MKTVIKFIATLATYLFCFGNSIYSQQLEPTQKEALFFILIVDTNDKPIEEKIVLKSLTTGKTYSVESNKQGIAEALVPINNTYSINLEFEPDYDKVVIPNESFYRLHYKVFYDKHRLAQISNASIHLSLFNSKKTFLSEEITLVSTQTGNSYSVKTNELGKAVAKVPINDTYTINLQAATEYAKIEIPNIENYNINYEIVYEGSTPNAIYPSLSEALFSFTFLDLDSLPVPNENFYLHSKKNGKVYKCNTDKNGTCKILAPINDTYNISSEYFKNFASKPISSQQTLNFIDITLVFTSSIEYLKQKAERKKLLEARELEWESKRMDFEKYLKTKVDNPSFTYTPMQDSVVSSVLNRNPQWKNKLIILDVTGSMTPYTLQVEMWYKLNFSTNDPIQFVMFNDGNNRPDFSKKIGSTGGIHYCKYCTVKTFADSLTFAREAGTGGDGPENDLEATIKAMNTCKNYSEIILVADNYSMVKDIELLHLIEKPIKIILCGAQHNPINTDYLNLAYHSNGSIHTIEQDIVNIGKTLDGKRIKIGKKTYLLTNGKFVFYKDDRK